MLASCSSDTAAALMLDHVQPAFFFHRSRPAPGTLVFTGGDGAGARPATNARVALIVERVVRNVVVENELPDVVLGPLQQRVDLHQLELRVPLDDVRLAPIRR